MTKAKKIRLGLMILSLIISLFAFEEVVDDVFSDPLEGDFEALTFDRNISQWIVKLKSPGLTQAMIDLTALGSVSVIITLFIILTSLMVVYRDLKGLIYLVIVFAGGGILPQLLKTYFGRVRPVAENHLVHATNFSFPSGHAFGATCAYFALAFYSAQYAKRKLHEMFFYFLGAWIIFLVCFSRIYLGVHYPTDVLGGVASGFAWVMFISVLFRLDQKSP